MFKAAVIWRGFIYTILMVFGKLICGIWLICCSKQFNLPRSYFSGLTRTKVKEPTQTPQHGVSGILPPSSSSQNSAQPGPNNLTAHNWSAFRMPSTQSYASPKPDTTPVYQGAVLGFAMVTRGEIGFLISSLAESRGVFESSSDIFLVVTWAIMLCTIIGPLGMGLLVRKARG